jgi:hypothetical protein
MKIRLALLFHCCTLSFRAKALQTTTKRRKKQFRQRYTLNQSNGRMNTSQFSSDPWFKSGFENQLSWLQFHVILVSPSKHMPQEYFQTDHHGSFPQTFQFIIKKIIQPLDAT